MDGRMGNAGWTGGRSGRGGRRIWWVEDGGRRWSEDLIWKEEAFGSRAR